MELRDLPMALRIDRAAQSAYSGMPPVLVPLRAIAPGLHRALRAMELQLSTAGNSCSSAEQWLQRLARHALAMPSYQLPASHRAEVGGLRYVPLPNDVQTTVGALLPMENRVIGLLGQTLEQVKRRIRA